MLTPSRRSALLLTVCLGLVPSCSGAPADPRPNVLLIVIDTTRQDRLSTYGYGRKTTPSIDALAESSAVYTNAHSTSAWTCAAHASLFTGLYPAAHHVTQEAWELPEALVTLAEVLRDAGFRTAGIAGNPMVRAELGFAQGFDEYHETWRKDRKPAASEGGPHAAIEQLEAFVDADDAPFFAFVNLIEPHSPYTSGPYLDTFRSHPDNTQQTNRWRAFFAGEVELTQEDLDTLSERYDGELLYADAIVGELIDVLAARELLDETLVVITSDHGENFGDHGLVDHVFNLYDSTTRVPLIVRHPATFAAGRYDDPVQVHDLFPTLLAVAGVRAPDSQGVDLARATIDPARPLLLSYGYPEQALRAMGATLAESEAVARFKRRLWAVCVAGDKLIVGDDGSVEYYRVGDDPDERDDLAAQDPARVAELRAALDALLEASTREAPGAKSDQPGGERDAATLEELRSLGYAE